MTLKDYRIAPLNSDTPESVVVFLHGLGDNGSGGLLDIGKMWQGALPKTEFLCPDAPFVFDMAPPDFGGRQWFSLQEFTQKAVEEGVKMAAPILNEYIDKILSSRRLQSKRVALVGFSQGTMMALHVALRRIEPVAAIVGYSGRLVFGKDLPREKLSSPPILLIHGTADAVIPFSALVEAEQELKAANIGVESLACPQLGHSIDEDGLMAGLIFLQKYL